MPIPQITVLDAGGQYCHLIARKVRDLGIYADVQPSDTPAHSLTGRKGLIISGGPSSVYDPGSPRIDEAILSSGTAVLGICYGLQLMAHALGGMVRKGEAGEYGMALLETVAAHPLLSDMAPGNQVWMSHRDRAESVPDSFDAIATTSTCSIAAMAHRNKPLLAVQFHPEVEHTEHGNKILAKFVFDICGCERDWDPKDRIAPIEAQIRRIADNRNIFFFVSGGVDSTVAYTLCLRALGTDRVYGIYVDTGLMRDGETEYVRSLFAHLGAKAFHIEAAQSEFLKALEGVSDPELKRHIIGEQFVSVQDRILKSGRFLDGSWILGQGTIYPDTIESGGTAKADLIKTHHNRVAGIQKLIEEGRIVEPLTAFYKDEVREIGRELGVSDDFLNRHPFPGPGLAIRCLCSEAPASLNRRVEGWVIPVRTVGVQGDSRTFQQALMLDEPPSPEALVKATRLTNELAFVNRVIAMVGSRVPAEKLEVLRGFLNEDRLARLRIADAIVRRSCEQSGFEQQVWQFPVVLLPVGDGHAPDSVVLRPIHSVDGMTAQVILMPSELLASLCKELLEIEGVAAVFYDLTHKPPGTIEWE